MKFSAILCAVLLAVAAAPARAEIQVGVRLEAFDLAGDPISEIPLGSDFELRGYVDDVRLSTPVQNQSGDDLFGVFAAYLDILFDGAKASAAGPVDVDDYFDDFPSATLAFALPGRIQVGGATSNVSNPGPAEQLLFSAPLSATAPGPVAFSPAYLSDSEHEWLVWGDFAPVPSGDVQFSALEVTIVPEPASLVSSAIGLVGLAAWGYRRRRRKPESDKKK